MIKRLPLKEDSKKFWPHLKMQKFALKKMFAPDSEAAPNQVTQSNLKEERKKNSNALT